MKWSDQNMRSSKERTRYLLIDVGAGTMDVLYHVSGTDMSYKAVVRSPVQSVSEEAAQLPGDLLVTGVEMGGGRLSEVLRERARSSRVFITEAAAMTLSHDLRRVRSWGMEVISEGQAEELAGAGSCSSLFLTDLPLDRLERIVTGFGVPFEFDVVGVCAQDHGMPPEGVSHLDYRHNLFKSALDDKPYPDALLYEGREVPETFNRLRSLSKTAEQLPAGEVYVMDSGFAAILGASMDLEARKFTTLLVLDIATSHTVGAALRGNEIAGFFEYHTRDITLEKLESLLNALARGSLDHVQVLKEGGHGAYIRESVGLEAVKAIIATGPRRRLVEPSRLPIHFGAPFGDNMMTGTVGLLEAIRRRKGLPSMIYV